MKPITSGQKDQCVNVIKDAARKAAEEALNELVANGVINSNNFQRVLECGNKLSSAIQTFVKEQIAKLAENIKGIVKLISGAEVLELDETDRKATIAEAKETFPGWIDSDFEDYGTNVPSPATGKMNVSVHEMTENGTFERIFGGMGGDLNSLCLTQPQIIQFVQRHRKWLRTEGYATFFLLKVDEKFFVASVCFDGGGQLLVGVDRLSDGRVWYAEYRHRVVVPQLVSSEN